MSDMVFALEEEIGNPELFVGRQEQLEFYLDWAEKSKDRLSKSQAILSRRKKGKTALVQRLFNILYANNDPRIVPFYYRVREDKHHKDDFALLFYQAFVTQYIGFQKRDTNLINDYLPLENLEELAADDPVLLDDIKIMQKTMEKSPALAWDRARDAPHRIASKKDIRIIQIIDEFQYLNRFIVDTRFNEQVDLCFSYMGAAESKVAPLLVTGSYIGWLMSILSYMTARFEYRGLPALTDVEALATVYNYAARTNRPINDDTATLTASD